MPAESFADAVREEPFLLAEGGIETRIVFGTDYRMDPVLEVAAMVEDPRGRPLLRDVYADYAAVGCEFRLPMILGTPTFRASPDRVRQAGLAAPDALQQLNAACAALIDEVRSEFADVRIYMAGVIGPRGDAYKPEVGLSTVAAAAYHRPQAQALTAAGVDFLFAPTFPNTAEATGAAQAMAATGRPYVVSFVLRRDGRVMDGTPLADAMARIDAEVAPRPLYYSLSCVYPTVAAEGLAAVVEVGEFGKRVLELKANASSLSPEELVRLGRLDAGDPEAWAAGMESIHERFGLRILGGCCGTDARHLRALAARIVAMRR